MLSMGKIIFKIFVLVCVFSGCSKNTIDKIYYNGTIWTGDYEAPFATAMVLNQEKFIFVGIDADAMDMASSQTEMIDLKGNFVTPGFIDNHVHFISGGLHLSRVNLNDVSSKHEFQKRIVDFQKMFPGNSWILGGNWDHELWGGMYPDKSWIDEVASDRPVFLDRLDGHMGLANTKAMNIAGIHASTLDPSGGVIVRDQNGNPTGVLKDLAMDLVLAILPEESLRKWIVLLIELWSMRFLLESLKYTIWGLGKIWRLIEGIMKKTNSKYELKYILGIQTGEIL